MQPTMTAQPGKPGAPGPLAGAARQSRNYYDEAGRLRTAAKPVPIDQFGRIAGAEFDCRRCRVQRWFPLGLKGEPVCEGCDRRMVPARLRNAPLLPWRELWTAAERPLRPVWALPALAAAGAGVDAAQVSGWVPTALAPIIGVAATRVARRRLLRVHPRWDVDDPEGQKRLRAAVDRAARAVGYTSAATCGWLGLAAGIGVHTHSAPGFVALWGSLLAGWAVPAASWWRRERNAANRPAPVEPEPELELEPETPESLVDPGEAEVLRIWSTVVAAKQGQVIGTDDSGQPTVALRSGRLVGSRLEDWHRVAGGWAATAVGPDGAFTAEAFTAARGSVASAFRMKASMITVIPDADDENRAMVLAQRSSPIKDSPRWAGPDSIDVEHGVAPIAVYADGEHAMYEIFRPGWGCPHVGIFGTTGSAKSSVIEAIFAIDRWAHYVDADGVPRGIVADFLVDPQQGQSLAPFLDDLAAPVACSLEEALLLVRALTAEALRRNRYLAREAKTWDAKRKKWRTGRKWWNPLVDGPILALTIDEAHDYLANREFATLVTKAGRMWRKCGLQVRVATHTPLLSDLGGSMALRDMLTGGFVWVGRTANSLTTSTAFNGRLPVDARTIPPLPGLAYILTGAQPKPMLARTMWEPDYYDWVRDENDEPIGYPAVLPQVTLDALGPEYARWVRVTRAGELWAPTEAEKAARPVLETPGSNVRCVDAVLLVMAAAFRPLNMDELDAELDKQGLRFSTRTVREALATLRKADPPLVVSRDGRHDLTQRGTEEALTRSELLGAAA